MFGKMRDPDKGPMLRSPEEREMAGEKKKTALVLTGRKDQKEKPLIIA